ncbi:MAG: hypothetical protein K0Q72_4418 [Armatimonadetes bacterium]|jgi:hypothetical protein|nr:hypothetical protein [Armatimonadota bacterium]
MTSRQRLAFIILQLNYGYSSWREALRLARAASLGNASDEARAAAEAVRASLEAADAALEKIQGVAVPA